LIEIRKTANYSANLDSIEAYWDTCQFPVGNDRLMTELAEAVMVHLQNHPRLGRNFLRRQTPSIETQSRQQKLEALLATLGTDTDHAEIREYVMTDYLLLYALVGAVIYLLAIKHHKQLSFLLDVSPSTK
jgi:hypothetical protein